MKQFVLILCLVGLAWTASAQNFTSHENCYVTDFIFNPAVAGTPDELNAVLSVKKTWIGVSQGPMTGMLNLFGKVADYGFSGPKKYISNTAAKTAMGLSLFTDKNGPLATNGLQLAYDYLLPLGERATFSLGLSAKLIQYRIDQREFLPHDPIDPMINYNLETVINPNFNAGACLFGQNYIIGLSMTNLVNSDLRGRDFYYDELIRTWYVSGMCKLRQGRSIAIWPNILLRFHENENMQLNAAIKFVFVDRFMFSPGWASDGSFNLTVAVIVKKISFGYTFEYTRSPLYSLSNGNHLFFVGFNFK